jgi:acyl carrier protein
MRKTVISSGDEIKILLRKFIAESFLPSAGLNSFEDTDSFMEKGIVDSTGVLELLEFIEGKFEIVVEDEEVIPDNLDSLAKITSFIERKLKNAGK